LGEQVVRRPSLVSPTPKAAVPKRADPPDRVRIAKTAGEIVPITARKGNAARTAQGNSASRAQALSHRADRRTATWVRAVLHPLPRPRN